MHSKTLLYFKLVLLNLLLFLVVLTYILTLNGRSLTTVTSYFFNSSLSNYTELSGINNISTSNITSIDIELKYGNVSIYGYSDDGICVVYNDQNVASCYYIVENSTLKIKIDENDTTSNLIDGDIEIYIPNGLLHQLDIETSAGDIKVFSYGNKLNLTTISGEIHIADGYNENNIKTSSGDIYVYPQLDYLETLNVTTVSGNCSILHDTLNCTTNFSSVSGKLVSTCNFDDSGLFDFIINFSSVSGSLNIGE